MSSDPDKRDWKAEVQNFFNRVKRNSENSPLLHELTKASTRDTIAFVLLLTGLILLFFEPTFAGILIGVIVGLYFSYDITHLFKNYQELVDRQGVTRSVILGGLLVAFFIEAPFIFFGAIIAAAVKQLIASDDASK